MRKIFGATLVAAVLACVTPLAHAGLITFDLSYAGVNNSAVGTGSITFNDAILPNPGNVANVPAGVLGVTAFSITISGAATGNGTFGLAHVTNWIWQVSSPLNLNNELVGQVGFLDFNWCALNFVGCFAPAPGGISPFTISTNGETGDVLRLASMRRAAVPESSALTLLALGLIGLGFLRRKSIR